MSKTNRKTAKVTHFDVKTREPLIVALINGATKAGITRDQRKEQSRKACRDRRAWNYE